MAMRPDDIHHAIYFLFKAGMASIINPASPVTSVPVTATAFRQVVKGRDVVAGGVQVGGAPRQLGSQGGDDLGVLCLAGRISAPWRAGCGDSASGSAARPLASTVIRLASTVIRPYYLARRQAAEKLLAESMPESIEWRIHESQGGMFCWLGIKEPWFDDVQVLSAARA
jgi:hypothetical protein